MNFLYKYRRQLEIRRSIQCLPALIVVALLSCSGLAANASPFVQDSQPVFHLKLRDGSLIRVACKDESVSWKSVSGNGEITESQIRVAHIKSISLALESASEQVAAIRKLIDALNSDDFTIRNDAETKLGTEGLPFYSIIEQFRGHADSEAKYRQARVLDRLKNGRDDTVIPTSLQFDKLEMVDGQRLEGDIGDWVLNGQWNGMTISVDRKNCSGIANSTDGFTNPPAVAPSAPITGNYLTDPGHFLENDKPRPGFTFVDFETGNGNVALPFGVKDPVDRFFTFAGCLFHCDTNKGDVVVSTYKFRKGISRQNSLCNLHVDPVSGKLSRFTGVMRIEFCLPGQPGFPAGVHAVGAGAELVVPKQSLVEAWNSAGHVVGLTYANMDRNSFLGAESSDLIVALTVGANSYLDLEKINEDYAIDDLCFSTPVPAPDLNRSGNPSTSLIVTRDGDQLVANSILFPSGQSKVEFVLPMNQQSVSLPIDKVRWIIGPQDGLPKSRSFDGISVMTRDGSVIQTSAIGLASINNPALVIPTEEVIGIWNSSTPARYPRPADFEYGNAVVVRPLQRIAGEANLDWAAGTIKFNLEKTKTMRQSLEAGANADEVLPTVLEDFELEPVADSSFRIAELTNIWTAPPMTRAAGTGLLRTSDGQQFILGGASGFSLVEADGSVVTISRGDQSLSFVTSQIYALEFPDK